MERAFETDRLLVFSGKVDIDSEFECGEKRLYVAFTNKYLGDLMPHVTILVQTFTKPGEQWSLVEWVETSAVCQRKGFATELLTALKKHLPHTLRLTEGTTEAGEAFIKAFRGSRS